MYSGREVTPPNTGEGGREREIHTSAAASFEILQNYSATRDRDITTNSDYNSCDVTREIAKFYVNRAKYNSA